LSACTRKHFLYHLQPTRVQISISFVPSTLTHHPAIGLRLHQPCPPDHRKVAGMRCVESKCMEVHKIEVTIEIIFKLFRFLRFYYYFINLFYSSTCFYHIYMWFQFSNTLCSKFRTSIRINFLCYIKCSCQAF